MLERQAEIRQRDTVRTIGLRSREAWRKLRQRQQELGARQLAEAEIAGVMAEKREEARVVAGASRDPALDAIKLVGKALGLEIRDHPEVDKRAPLPERLLAVAKASRFRTRSVALRDDWYRRDQGPILAMWEEGGGPVALLPRGLRIRGPGNRRPGRRRGGGGSQAFRFWLCLLPTLSRWPFICQRPYPLWTPRFAGRSSPGAVDGHWTRTLGCGDTVLYRPVI
ncbi:MAG: hypothetical protein ACUVRY_10280 [Thermoanaerobaculaceae bacterium]